MVLLVALIKTLQGKRQLIATEADFLANLVRHVANNVQLRVLSDKWSINLADMQLEKLNAMELIHHDKAAEQRQHFEGEVAWCIFLRGHDFQVISSVRTQRRHISRGLRGLALLCRSLLLLVNFHLGKLLRFVHQVLPLDQLLRFRLFLFEASERILVG